MADEIEGRLFVGGPVDGHIIQMEAGRRDWHVPEIDMSDVLDPPEPSPVKDATLSGSTTTYTARRLSLSDSYYPLRFMAPADWSDSKAFQYMFERYAMLSRLSEKLTETDRD